VNKPQGGVGGKLWKGGGKGVGGEKVGRGVAENEAGTGKKYRGNIPKSRGERFVRRKGLSINNS